MLLLAATPRKRPLHFVPADSVMTWGYDGTDFRLMALATDSTLTSHTVRLTRRDWKARRSLPQQWEQRVRRERSRLLADAPMLAAAALHEAARIWLLTGQAWHFDLVEHLIYSTLIPAVSTDTLPAHSMPRWMAAQALIDAPGMLMGYDGDDLWLNFYTNATTRVHTATRSYMLDLITDMPRQGQVRLRFMHLKEGKPFTIHLRMPHWAVQRDHPLAPPVAADAQRAMPAIYVSGHEWDNVVPDADGYIHLTRSWRSGDEVYFTLPVQNFAAPKGVQ